MKRRDLFRLGAQKTAQAVLGIADKRAAARAKNWIRPPYALQELDFLLACTRCDKCIEACPHELLFTLPPRLGLQVADTPAMDLLNHGCHLCEDWPCVTICEPKALKFPDSDFAEPGEGKEPPKKNPPPPPPLPKLARVTINEKACLPYFGPECGACGPVCPVPGAIAWDDGTKPRIVHEICTGCALCRDVCVVQPKAVNIASIAATESTTETPTESAAETAPESAAENEGA